MARSGLDWLGHTIQWPFRRYMFPFLPTHFSGRCWWYSSRFRQPWIGPGHCYTRIIVYLNEMWDIIIAIFCPDDMNATKRTNFSHIWCAGALWVCYMARVRESWECKRHLIRDYNDFCVQMERKETLKLSNRLKYTLSKRVELCGRWRRRCRRQWDITQAPSSTRAPLAMQDDCFAQCSLACILSTYY